MRRLLIPFDASKCGAKALEYVARQYGGLPDVEITLVHVLPSLPALFWDDGHILDAEEERDRVQWEKGWLSRHRQKMTPILLGAARRLQELGFDPGRVRTLFVDDAIDAAASLLDAARQGGFDTIVLGRCGIAEGRHFLVGSLTSRLVHQAAGVAVCVVQ